MKRIVFLLALTAMAIWMAGCAGIFQEPASPGTSPAEVQTTPTSTTGPVKVHNGDIKAIWLSQFDLSPVYTQGGIQREQGEFTQLTQMLLDNVAAQGFNTVFLQIRPNCDSMYPSSYYPMSAYVTGELGRQASYDPVAIVIRLAHSRGLSVHAWINPMRGMKESQIQLVDPQYPIRQWYDDPQLRGKLLVLVEGSWYLNPAYEQVRSLILSGAQEALERYDFDGLHMDDYFYPTADPSFDQEAFALFGGVRSLADFRRDNLNVLVKGLYGLTHDREGRIFGISPAGNVDTVYNQQFADVYAWCAQPGYVDYICPQVYFGLEHGSHDFQKVCRTYQSMIGNGDVGLVVGMTFGKALSGEDPWAGSGKNEWKEHKDILARCLETTRELESCSGVSVFCYQYLFDPLTGQPVPETSEEREAFTSLLKEISWK